MKVAFLFFCHLLLLTLCFPPFYFLLYSVPSFSSLCFSPVIFLICVSPLLTFSQTFLFYSSCHYTFCRSCFSLQSDRKERWDKVWQHKLGWDWIPVNYSRAWATSQTLWELALPNPFIREHVIAINFCPVALCKLQHLVSGDLSLRISVCSTHGGCLYIQHKSLDIIRNSHCHWVGEARTAFHCMKWSNRPGI